MGVVFTNNAETTLAAAITSTSATSISVTSSSTFPAIQAGEHFYATLDDGTNNEIVKVTGVSGTTWTVVRASDSTTARTFANGITVQLRATAALLTDIQENIAAKSANQTVYNATAASNATAYDVGVNPGVEANAMVFLDGVMQHHDTFSFSGSTLTFDAAPTNGTKIEVIVDNLINLQSSNLTTDTFTATSGQTAFTLSDAPAAENNLIVFIDGVFQDQGNYSISNHTLTLATGAVVGRTVTVYIINPVNIGTPSDGTVTSAKLSGNITMPGTLTVGAFDVAFDSPTFFVDNANSRVGLGTSTPSVPVDIVGEVKISSHLNMPDNAKAKFGAGEDATIFSDGTSGYIRGFTLQNKAGDKDVLTFADGGATSLFHNNSAKLATTSTGIDVTGTAVTDGLTSSGHVNISSGLSYQWGDSHERIEQSDGKIEFFTNNGEAMTLSSGNLGIGNTSPATNLHIGSGTEGENLGLKINRGSTTNFLVACDGTKQAYIGVDNTQGFMKMGSLSNHPVSISQANTNAIYIDTSKNVGIGTTSPDNILHISTTASGGPQIHLDTGTGSAFMNFDGTNLQLSTQRDMVDGTWHDTSRSWGGINIMGTTSGSKITFTTAGNNNTSPTTRMTIDKDGRVTKPSQPYFSVKPSSDQSISVTTWTDIAWGTETTDTGGNFASNTFTAPVAGVYLFTGVIGLNTIAATNYLLVRMECSTAGSHYITHEQKRSGGGDYGYDHAISQMITLAASETVKIQIFAGSGGTHQVGSRSLWQGILLA